MTFVEEVLRRININLVGKVKDEYKNEAFDALREILKEIDANWAIGTHATNNHYFENELVNFGAFDTIEFYLDFDDEINEFAIILKKKDGNDLTIGPLGGAYTIPVRESIQVILEKTAELIDYLDPLE